jgi:hypothetical protein
MGVQPIDSFGIQIAMKCTPAAPLRTSAMPTRPARVGRMRLSIPAGVAAIFLSALCCAHTWANDRSLDQGARDAGRATGSAIHDIGQGAKKIGVEIGHAAADAGKKIGHGFAEMGRSIGSAAKEGGKEFWHAVKGGD